MKGKYNICHMTIYSHVLPGSISIAHSAVLVYFLTLGI